MNSKATHRYSYYLKFAYYLGVFFGIFTFSINPTSKNFELSKKLQIYNRIIATIILICAIRLCFVRKDTIPIDNLVIQIATPLNFFLVAAILLNSYIIIQLNEQEVVNMMNFGLEIKNYVAKNEDQFAISCKFFFCTFALDGFFLFFFLAIIYRGIFVVTISKYALYIVLFLNGGKNISRFVTHLYICAIEFTSRLMISIELELKESIEKLEDFLNLNSSQKNHQLVKKCCQLSDKLDDYDIQCSKILYLINRIHGLFSGHLLLMIIYNMSDVLVLVSFTL